MKIVADDKIPFLKGVLEPYAEVIYLPGKEITKKDISDADALIVRTRTKCDKNLLEGTSIKFIATATIGYDHVDTEYCKKNNITWINAPGCNSGSVMQYITAALLYLAKKQNFKLKDKTIGIIGVGNVGIKVEKIARTLGMEVLLNDPPRARSEGNEKFKSLNEIIECADIITLHVPLTYEGIDKTYHLFDDKILSRLSEKVILINTSRGEVVENIAIRDALAKGKLSACVLDVWENEPTIDIELLKLVDIATPHIAGYSLDGKANGTSMSVQALSRFFNLPLNNWFPVNIYMAHNNVIEVNAQNKSLQQILEEIVFYTYPIEQDSVVLKKSPETFEKQRAEYRIRREFFNYYVKLINSNSIIDEKTTKIGFKLAE